MSTRWSSRLNWFALLMGAAVLSYEGVAGRVTSPEGLVYVIITPLALVNLLRLHKRAAVTSQSIGPWWAHPYVATTIWNGSGKPNSEVLRYIATQVEGAYGWKRDPGEGDSNEVVLETKMNVASFGERVGIVVTRDGNGVVSVTVSSVLRKSQVTDWGQNRRNVNKAMALLGRLSRT